MSAMVIKEWKTDTKPIDDKNNFIGITGRQSGLIAWMLSLMGVDPTTRILVGVDRAEFTANSLAGTESRMLPLQGICSTYYGYHKPWKQALSYFLMGLFIAYFLMAAQLFTPALLVIFASAVIAWCTTF